MDAPLGTLSLDPSTFPLTKGDKPTSMGKALQTATDSGWATEVVTGLVQVKDPANTVYPLRGRGIVPVISVEGYLLICTEGRATWGNEEIKATLAFTSDGRYAPLSSRGDFPFRKEMTLTTVLERLVECSPEQGKARETERTNRDRQRAIENLASAKEGLAAAWDAYAVTRKALSDKWLAPERASTDLFSAVIQALTATEGPEYDHTVAQHNVRHAQNVLAVAQRDYDKAHV